MEQTAQALRDVGKFFHLEENAEKVIAEELAKYQGAPRAWHWTGPMRERRRLIDSMVDVHHYMYGKKVAIFGDPDLVSAIVRFCAELILGNSKGKDVADDKGVPLVRFGFPVYDRVGVYRYSIMGYNGSIYLLDLMTNAILEHKYDPNKLYQ